VSPAIPASATAGFFAPVAVYALVLALHLVMPARRVDGYVIDPATQRPYRYRLNGLEVYAATFGIWALLCSRGLLAWDFFWTTRWEGLAGACAAGLVFTFAVVLPAPSTGKPLLADLYLGRLENPQWLGGRVVA
jgi:delta14-sterol reductase